MNKKPDIFNDVIGPVMRGPSSSHTAASWRIANICLALLNEPLKKAIVDFDRNGAWAPNFREQGTCLGIEGGLLGLDMTDDRMKNTAQMLVDLGVSVNYEINSFKTDHVNTVRLKLEGIHGNSIRVLAVSLGGGSFEIRNIDGFDIRINGGYYELLLSIEDNSANLEKIKALFSENSLLFKSTQENRLLVNLKFSDEISADTLNKLRGLTGFEKQIIVKPVLPIIEGNDVEVPFSSIDSLLEYASNEDYDLGEIGLIYEKCLSGLPETDVIVKMKNIVGIIEKSIVKGLAGTEYEDRILPQQSHLVQKAQKKGKILPNSIINQIVANVSAIMESKSAMEVVVANPTAGSCGAVGGVLRAVADEIKASDGELVKAYFASGIIGAYFAMGPGFSAEEHGCQVECGASSGMAAAGIVQLFGGTAKQAIDAASMAIQNMIGLVCDPIADRVEAPCLGKNISAAVNALTSATMACSGFNALIPLNEVIETVSSVSSQMPSCVKCTGKGGLAITKTACDLKEKLKSKSAPATS
ncbi:L-serine ammonia-lyase, iron-sulfur-dependent, subunit alpha [Maribacter sp. HTCC2170]|uniref:L-serine ammonia-lyase, iron-sulfur-dependent, subunit alpha n=1 Tax=Maribacter sp. (strain HTCC2170 / KCCM 42371) TaxID=313603 RepID=UPI00006BD2E7|nr:L-serine ammonia-lyase, iron-sulfur-dependent, subunit alpha [Maribacter sp. HTCC2170]EAR02440.1 probable L-serine dehydratase, alpha chain [Maribacter sp. HTCC2170]